MFFVTLNSLALLSWRDVRFFPRPFMFLMRWFVVFIFQSTYVKNYIYWFIFTSLGSSQLDYGRGFFDVFFLDFVCEHFVENLGSMLIKAISLYFALFFPFYWLFILSLGSHWSTTLKEVTQTWAFGYSLGCSGHCCPIIG